MTYSQKLKYFEFYQNYKQKYGKFFVVIFQEIKKQIKKISNLERLNYHFAFMTKHKLIPKTIKLHNKKLELVYKNHINKLESKILEIELNKHLNILKQEKKGLFKNKSSFIRFYAESETIETFYFLNRYKNHVDSQNYKKKNKKHKFLIRKYNIQINKKSDQDICINNNFEQNLKMRLQLTLTNNSTSSHNNSKSEVLNDIMVSTNKTISDIGDKPLNLSSIEINVMPRYYEIFDSQGVPPNASFSLFPGTITNSNSYLKSDFLVNDNHLNKIVHHTSPSNSPHNLTNILLYQQTITSQVSSQLDISSSDMNNTENQNKKGKRNKSKSMSNVISNYNLRSKKHDDTQFFQLQKQKCNKTENKHVNSGNINKNVKVGKTKIQNDPFPLPNPLTPKPSPKLSSTNQNKSKLNESLIASQIQTGYKLSAKGFFDFNNNKNIAIINTGNNSPNHISPQYDSFKLYTPPPTPKLKSIIGAIINDELSPIKIRKRIGKDKKVSISHNNAKIIPVLNQNSPIIEAKMKDNKSEKKENTHKLHNTFLNLTDKEVPQDIEEYLKKGYNQTITRLTSKHKYDEMTDLEYLVRVLINKETRHNATLINLDHKQRDDIYNLQMKSKSKIKTLKQNKFNSSKIKKTKDYLKDNDLTITLADKSKTLVLLEVSTYNTLMLRAIKENNFTKLETNTNVTKERKMQDLIRNLRSEEKLPLSKSEYDYIYPSGCPCPNLFGKIKIHKNPITLRPIVNASSAYFTRISKWLIKNVLLKYVYKTYAVKNSYEFKNKLIGIQIEPNDFMFSLDATSMYSYLPREDIIKYFLHRYKYDKNKNKTIKLRLLSDILQQCTSDICVEYNGEYYTQAGLAMGSAISPVFGEVALYLIENRLLKKKSLKVKLLVHYADDIFVLAGHKDSAEDTLTYINEISKDLKFTLETETEGILNYLDITIIRSEQSLEFKVYRKPDANNLRINYLSEYQMHTKLNVLNQEIIRAYRLCSNNLFLKQELCFIRNTYIANNYPLELINNKIAYIDRIAIRGFTNINKKDETLKYHSIIIQNQELKSFLDTQLRKLKKTGNWKSISEICLAQAPPVTLYQSICHQGKMSTASIHRQNIVYQSKCLKCQATYIGCTERNYSLRFKEHMTNETSALKLHSNIGNGHEFDLSKCSFKILSQEENNIRRFIKEGLMIQHERPSLNVNAGITLITKPL